MRILNEALTFDDVLLVPAHSAVLPRDVDLSTRLTRDIRLNLPIVSAAMDTVTEARLAITMAQSGGIGIIHKNMSIERQAAEVRLVKKFEAGVIRDPVTVAPQTSIREVMQITRAHNISGVPVVDGEQLVERAARYVQAFDVDVGRLRQVADRRLDGADLALAAVDDPAQDAQVVAEAGP